MGESENTKTKVTAASNELTRGKVITRNDGDRELVLFRGTSGRVYAMNAYRPHLGAHLGHGGRVDGETIVCPFHGFKFNGAGECIAAYPGRKVPKTCINETFDIDS